jgi:O-antigen/teichoic acid export membrane protein
LKSLVLKSIENIKKSSLSRDIVSSVSIRGFNILLNLFILPLSIRLLSQEQYGIWLTISALNAWVSIFDLGTQNTLRNKLATCVADDSKLKLRGLLITNSFLFSFILFAIISIISTVLYFTIDFVSVLNIKSANFQDINKLILVSLLVFGFKLFTNNINSILFALQKTYLTLLIITSANLASILILLVYYLEHVRVSLIQYGFIFLFADVAISIVFPVIYLKAIGFKFEILLNKINYKFFRKYLLSSNVRFFIISILIVFTFFSDNFFIGVILSYNDVVAYNLVNKYFNSLTMISVVVLNPVWTQVSIYAVKREMEKITSLLNKLYKYFFGFVILAILLILFSNLFYNKFGDGKINISYVVTIVAAIATLQLLFNNIHAYVLNGLNKTTEQIICLTAGSLVMIPTYYFLLKYLHTGIVGSFMVQIIVFLPMSVFLPYYLSKHLKSD